MSINSLTKSPSHFNSLTPSPESSDSSSSSVNCPSRPISLPKNFTHPRSNYLNNQPNSPSQNVNNRTNINADEQLPIHLVKRQLMTAIDHNESLIVIGETGCGKTTQIPQFIYENYTETASNEASLIGITQPRRVAAISVATRVASEMGVQAGDLIGYTVRFENQISPKTRVKYMTDGILLRESIGDPLLSKYSLLIIDEAHERTVHTDVLFGILKMAQRLRKAKRKSEGDNEQISNNRSFNSPLKLIIMSATMDVDHFSKYFNDAPVYCIAGRTYPIEIFYTEQKECDYVSSALTTIFQIHQEEDEIKDEEKNFGKLPKISVGGDILVFCTGQEEIESMIKTINDLLPHLNQYRTRSGLLKTLKAFPLYAALPLKRQQQVFTRLPNECFRRVIIATNIAETSVTIPNIRYVIDTGKVKTRVFSPTTGLEVMKVEDISKAQASQRAGRAGRVSSGQCYRLYSKSAYRGMRPFPIPDIQKCNLASVLLQLIAIGINVINDFDFIDSPSPDNIECSLDQLIDLVAIEEIIDESLETLSCQPSTSQGPQVLPLLNRKFKLTDSGMKIVKFPVDPRFAALVIASQKFKCTDPILIIISMLSVDSVFNVPNEDRESALRQHRKFDSTEGDLIKLLNVFRKYKENKESGNWCKENYLKISQLKMAVKIRLQLLELCQEVGIPLTSSHNTQVIRQCLTVGAGLGIGLGGNVAVLQRETGGYRVLDLNVVNNRSRAIKRPQTNVVGELSSKTVHIHPSSTLFNGTSKPECVLFVELVHTTKPYMRNCSLVDQQWLFTSNGNTPAPSSIDLNTV